MSIKLKNLGEFKVEVSMPGNASTGAKAVFVIPYPCILKAVLQRIRTAGTTGTQSVDIQKNGTTIFSSTTRLDFATAVTTPTYGALTTDPTSFAKGDLVTINAITVHTTPAVDWAAILVFQRKRNTGIVAAMVTDSVGIEAE